MRRATVSMFAQIVQLLLSFYIHFDPRFSITLTQGFLTILTGNFHLIRRCTFSKLFIASRFKGI